MKKRSLLAFSTAAVGVLTVFAVDMRDVEACSGSTPPPDCGISLTCSTAVNESFVAGLSTTLNGTVETGVVLQVTGSDPRCAAAEAQAQVDYVIDCIDYGALQNNPDGAQDWQRMGSGTLTQTVKNGLNYLRVPVRIDAGGTRRCEVSGKIAVLLSTGQTGTTQCGETDLCVGPKSNQMSAAAVELELVSMRPIVTAAPGEPILLTYQIRNNTDSTLYGSVSARSENPTRPLVLSAVPPPNPNPAEVCPSGGPTPPAEAPDCSEAGEDVECGCDGKSYYNGCLRENVGVTKLHQGACKPAALAASGFAISDSGSGNIADGIGDNFPLAWADDVANHCIALPENPALTMDVSIERAIQLGPNETLELGVVKRSWGLCADGSCAQTRIALIGALGGGSQADIALACGGSSLVIEENVPEFTGAVPRERYECDDSGTTPNMEVWTDADTVELIANTYDVAYVDEDVNHVPDWVEELVGFDPENDDFEDGFGLSQADLIAQGVTSSVGLEILFGVEEKIINVPFDPANPYETSNFSRVLTLYDSEGNRIDARIFFHREADGTWNYYVVVDGADIAGGESGKLQVILSGTLEFDANGSLSSHVVGEGTFDPVGGASGQSIEFDFAGTAIHDGPTTVNFLETSPTPMDAFWTHLEGQDTSGNGVPDIVQIMFGFAHNDAMEGRDLSRYSEDSLMRMDEDRDGLTDYDEIYVYRTRPIDPDTDGDGVSDGSEVLMYGTDPLHPDSDRGGVSDGDEIRLGLDPLNYSDDRNAAGAPLRSNPVAGVIFVGSEANLSTVVRKNASSFGAFSPTVDAQSKVLSRQVGRIEERVRFGSNLSPNATLEISVPYEAFPLNENSPYEVNRVEVGKKPQHPGHHGLDLTGAGYLRLSSSPYTVFEFLAQVSVWVVRPTTGRSERLKIKEFFFVANDTGYTLETTVELPDFPVGELIVLHDFNAHQSQAYIELCNDGEDNNGTGLVDCDDPYCSRDPACQEPWEPTDPTGPTGPTAPGGDDFGERENSTRYGDNDGCGCYGAGGGAPPADFLLILFGLGAVVASRRWTRRGRKSSAA